MGGFYFRKTKKHNHYLDFFAVLCYYLNTMTAFFSILFNPLVWLTIVAILAFLTWQNYKKIDKLTVMNTDSVLLALEIPKTNDKSELAAEQLLASLHGILAFRNI